MKRLYSVRLHNRLPKGVDRRCEHLFKFLAIKKNKSHCSVALQTMELRFSLEVMVFKRRKRIDYCQSHVQFNSQS